MLVFVSRSPFVLALVALLLGAACGSPAPRPVRTAVGAGPLADRGPVPAPPSGPGPGDAPPSGPATSRLESASTIPDEATWRRLAARPASQSVARTEVVKFLVDLEDGGRLWFVDTERWDIHYTFAHDRLSSPAHPVGSHEDFNVREYRRPERRFEMGSIVHYLDADLWALELVSGDTMGGPRIARLHAQVRAALYSGAALRFRPTSQVHEAALATLGGTLPTLTSEQVFAGVRYEPLTQGVAFGTLRIVRGPLEPSSARPDEILVLAHLPDEIPVVSGVVSAELQAPLGHIAILCATRGTPNMGLRDAMTDPAIVALEGQLVRLTVGTQEFSIVPAERADAEAAWAARRPATPSSPRLDARHRTLERVCDLRLQDAAFAGAKAAQLGEVCRLGGSIRTPGGFVVPIAHYLAHLDTVGLWSRFEAMGADPAFASDARIREAGLASLRDAIETAPVSPALLRELRQRMARTAPASRWILRSSTNAEDLAGFTGAGLYRSIVVPAGASEAQLEIALRQVWASVWLFGAFEERAWYRIAPTNVGMAVLAQPFVDGASANGVAITANPFFEGRPGHFVNVQALGGSVTGAGGDEVPEQHLIYTWTETIESELLARSSRSPEALLLGEAQRLELAEQLSRIHAHFMARWAGTGANACDVEFLIAGPERHVVIVQARPYTVVYGRGQTWQ